MAHPIHPELLLLGFRVRLPPSLPPSHGGKSFAFPCAAEPLALKRRVEMEQGLGSRGRRGAGSRVWARGASGQVRGSRRRKLRSALLRGMFRVLRAYHFENRRALRCM